MNKVVKAPFPYFGGKSGVAARIWERIGEVRNYVEPFCGSAAILLADPYGIPTRTINDADGFVSNFWRAVSLDPDNVAKWLDWPVNEMDLYARHVWLMDQRDTMVENLYSDPNWYDSKVAGWWCWGVCASIGNDWCSGKKVLTRMPHLGNGGQGIHSGESTGSTSRLPRLNSPGHGVNRPGLTRLPSLGNAGRGINRRIPHLTDSGMGIHRVGLTVNEDGTPIKGRGAVRENLVKYMNELADTLRRVRVTCGDWQRVCNPSVTIGHGLTGVVLDPPYGEGSVDYAAGGNLDKGIAWDVWNWAIENGDNPLYRIAVCGYDDGRPTPPGWKVLKWTARKGHQKAEKAIDNPARERVWFSPHCITPNQQLSLFE